MKKASSARESRRIRELRPRRPEIDPWQTPPWLAEEERALSGGLEGTLTLFLRGAECPFTCVYCDLWKGTLLGPTPRGALPRQIDLALEEAAGRGVELSRITRVKLYNASNFFEERAVPAGDEAAILARLEPFPEVTVECHPRLVGKRCYAFAEALTGRLEVAMGLETAHPEALARLNKGMTLADFDRAARSLVERGVGVRAFVLVGAPFVPVEEGVAWAVRSVEHALDQGAGRVSLIPVRGGNGEMERLRAEGHFQPPTLEQLEEALDGALAAAAGRGAVTADLWDLDFLVRCSACGPDRRARFQRINRNGAAEPPIWCPDGCGGGVPS